MVQWLKALIVTQEVGLKSGPPVMTYGGSLSEPLSLPLVGVMAVEVERNHAEGPQFQAGPLVRAGWMGLLKTV